MQLDEQNAEARRTVETAVAQITASRGRAKPAMSWRQACRGRWNLELRLDRHRRRRCEFTDAELDDLHSDKEHAQHLLRARISAALTDPWEAEALTGNSPAQEG